MNHKLEECDIIVSKHTWRRIAKRKSIYFSYIVLDRITRIFDFVTFLF